MGNIISFDGNVSFNDDSLVMSNSSTDVFVNIIALSGSEIAVTENQKRLIVFISEKDQRVIGGGTVSFDITDMPWNKDTFDEDKKFMLKVIKGARNKKGWKRLDYIPNEKMVSLYLDSFEDLIKRMTVDDIRENALKEWISAAKKDDPVLCGFPKCSKHNTFLTCFGCQVCNN